MTSRDTRVVKNSITVSQYKTEILGVETTRLIINAQKIEDLRYITSIIKKKDIVDREMSRKISEKSQNLSRAAMPKIIFNIRTHILIIGFL